MDCQCERESMKPTKKERKEPAKSKEELQELEAIEKDRELITKSLEQIDGKWLKENDYFMRCVHLFGKFFRVNYYNRNSGNIIVNSFYAECLDKRRFKLTWEEKRLNNKWEEKTVIKEV